MRFGVSLQGVAARCAWLCAFWSLGVGAAAGCRCKVLLPGSVGWSLDGVAAAMC